MGDEQHGRSFIGSLPDRCEHMQRCLRVQCRCGLVKQQHGRAEGQRTYEREALSLPTGELVGSPCEQVRGQTQTGKQRNWVDTRTGIEE